MAKYIKLLLVLGLMFLLHRNTQAQLPSLQYNGKVDLKDNLRVLRKEFSGVSFAAGFQQTNFLNPVFVSHLGTDYERTIGFYVGGRVTLYPFFIDIINSKNYFKIISIPGIEEDEVVTHRGWGFSFSTALLPYGKLARTLTPYAGIGYQVSQLCLHCEKTENDPDDLEIPFNAASTSAPFWKTGLSLSYGLLRIETEFEQALNLKNFKAFNSWRVGLGINFSKIKFSK